MFTRGLIQLAILLSFLHVDVAHFFQLLDSDVCSENRNGGMNFSFLFKVAVVAVCA